MTTHDWLHTLCGLEIPRDPHSVYNGKSQIVTPCIQFLHLKLRQLLLRPRNLLKYLSLSYPPSLDCIRFIRWIIDEKFSLYNASVQRVCLPASSALRPTSRSLVLERGGNPTRQYLFDLKLRLSCRKTNKERETFKQTYHL